MEKENKILRKLGFVKISILNPRPTDEDLSIRKLLFQNIIPLGMEMDNLWGNIITQKIFCHCDKFREIEDGEVYPEYEVMFRSDTEGVVTIESITEIK